MVSVFVVLLQVQLNSKQQAREVALPDFLDFQLHLLKNIFPFWC